MNRSEFFNGIRGDFTGKLEPDEVRGTEAILDVMDGAPLAHVAYALATAWHETAGTMQPIKEWGGAAYFHSRYDIRGARPDLAKRLGNMEPGDGVKFCGRGYVQLTGRANYAKASQKLGVDLIGNPDRAMECDIAARIMRQGMTEGWFTGKRFASYLPDVGRGTLGQYRDARRIINGIDRASDIARYAVVYQEALIRGANADRRAA